MSPLNQPTADAILLCTHLTPPDGQQPDPNIRQKHSLTLIKISANGGSLKTKQLTLNNDWRMENFAKQDCKVNK